MTTTVEAACDSLSLYRFLSVITNAEHVDSSYLIPHWDGGFFMAMRGHRYGRSSAQLTSACGSNVTLAPSRNVSRQRVCGGCS